ncbi:MAG: hypothetical protein ABI123_08585 [Ginsengibacter sp.]
MKYSLFIISICFTLAGYGQVSRPTIKSSNVTSLQCNGFGNGTITIVVSNGSPPYQYSINGGRTFQTENFFQGLKGGNYTLLVKDNRSQISDSNVVTIFEPSKLIINCSGKMECAANSGTVSVTASGGTPTYTYLWNAGPSPESAAQTGLPAGNYTVTVTDSARCSDTCSITPIATDSLKPKYSIGDSMSCGYVFYVDQNADSLHPCSSRYLICAFDDQSQRISWYNNTYITTNAVNDILFDKANADRIIQVSFAATACNAYVSTDTSCIGWYLPSKAELNLMYKNLAAKGIGGFAREGYWSSVEGTRRKSAWIVDFLSGREIQNNKSNKYHIRAVLERWIRNE